MHRDSKNPIDRTEAPPLTAGDGRPPQVARKKPPMRFVELPADAVHLIFDWLSLPYLYALRFLCSALGPLASDAFLLRAVKVIRESPDEFLQAVREIQSGDYIIRRFSGTRSFRYPAYPRTKGRRESPNLDKPPFNVVHLAPFTLGRLLRLAGVPGTSRLVNRVALSSGLINFSKGYYDRIKPVPFADLLRGMSLDKRDFCFQVEAHCCFFTSWDKEAVQKVFASTNFSESDKLWIICSSTAIQSGIRWQLIAQMFHWRSALDREDLDAFKVVYDCAQLVQSEADAHGFPEPQPGDKGTLIPLHRIVVDAFSRILFPEGVLFPPAILLASPWPWELMGRLLRSGSVSVLGTLKDAVELAARFGSKLPRAFGSSEIRQLISGYILADVPEPGDKNFGIISCLFSDRYWPATMPVQPADLLPTLSVRILSLFPRLIANTMCSIDRLAAFLISVSDSNDDELVRILQAGEIPNTHIANVRFRSLISLMNPSLKVFGALMLVRVPQKVGKGRGSMMPQTYDKGALRYVSHGCFIWMPNADPWTPHQAGEVLAWAFLKEVISDAGLNKAVRVHKLGAAMLTRFAANKKLDKTIPDHAGSVFELISEFVDGIVSVLRVEGKERASAYLGAILADVAGEWFPSSMLCSLASENASFGSLFATYPV